MFGVVFVSLVNLIIYFSLYFSAGATLKLGDDMLDELDLGVFAATPLAIAGTLFGFLMTRSEWDLVLFSAIIIGVIVSGKVNKYEYAIGFLIIGALLLQFGIPPVTDWLQWLGVLSILLFAAILDEKGNDWADKNMKNTVVLFFQYRLSLKVSVLFLAIPIPLFLPVGVGLWFFDTGYELVGWKIRKSLEESSDEQDYNTHL